MKEGVSKGVLIDIYSHLVIIRDLQSKAYGGLIKERSSEPLSKLLIDRTIRVSATLTSPKVLEVLVYGNRAKADATGEMLLQHDCFLQQPGTFDDSKKYYNPHCLFSEEDGTVPMWESVDEETDIRAANLSAGQKSKVAELLDSASGPTVFRCVQASQMLRTALKE